MKKFLLSALFLSALHTYAQLPMNQFGGYVVTDAVDLNAFLAIIEKMSLHQMVNDLHNKNTKHAQAVLKTCALLLNTAEEKEFLDTGCLVELIGPCSHIYSIMEIVYKEKAKYSENEARLLCSIGPCSEKIKNSNQIHLNRAASMRSMAERWRQLEKSNANR